MHGYVQTYLGLSNIVEICKQCTATAVQNTYILKSQLLENQDLPPSLSLLTSYALGLSETPLF